MLSAAQVKRQRKALWREIAHEERKKARELLRELQDHLRGARAARKHALHEAKSICKVGRQTIREQVKAHRLAAVARLRDEVHAMRQGARDACHQARTGARGLGSHIEQARAKLLAEKQYRADLRRIERHNQERRRELHPKRWAQERASESDDEVRGNINQELVPLFEKIKRHIKGSDRMSRTEAFLHYAEEHPDEILLSIEDHTDRLVRELEAKERAAHAHLRKTHGRRARAAAGGDEPPF